MIDNHLPEDPGEQLRLAMRQWASGIGIAATEVDGVRYGLTVSSFTSVSVDPPVVLISVHQDAQAHDPILKAGAFGVTLLSSKQQQLSDRFAGRIDPGMDRFDGLESFTLSTGSPLLPGGLAYFDCRLIDTYQTETTTVMFGEVVAARTSPEEAGGQPLLYYDRFYRRLTDE
jgi:flavin reductase (DIM6/NTAB) family NADH-FMN oxidoreductase RutF